MNPSVPHLPTPDPGVAGGPDRLARCVAVVLLMVLLAVVGPSLSSGDPDQPRDGETDTPAPDDNGESGDAEPEAPELRGRVVTGYQGWFLTPDDGTSEQRWHSPSW